MNKRFIISCLLVSCSALTAHAGHQKSNHQKDDYRNNYYPSSYDQQYQTGDYFYDFAKVSSVTPIIETIEHRVPQTCTHQTHYQQAPAARSNATPTILGTIIGAAIGNKLGHKKSNKRVGAVAGGILGASIGSNIGRDIANNDQQQQHYCQPRYETQYQEQIVGYNVKYRYRGKTYSTRTSEHPGNRIQMKIRFEPVIS